MITRLLEMARKRSCDKSRDVMDPLLGEGRIRRQITTHTKKEPFLAFYFLALYQICAIKIQKMGLLP